MITIYFQCGIDWCGKSRDGISMAITKNLSNNIYETSLFFQGSLEKTENMLAIRIKEIFNNKNSSSLIMNIPIIVDVPIDISNIDMSLFANTSNFDTEVTNYTLPSRDVDKGYKGMSPFSNLWGQVKRFRNFWRILNKEKYQLKYKLGFDLFETYPAASFEGIGFDTTGYKNSTLVWNGTNWDSNNKSALNLVEQLKIKGPSNFCIKITDNEIDAILCSMTNKLFNNSAIIDGPLSSTVITQKNINWPIGYLALKNIYWDEIIINDVNKFF